MASVFTFKDLMPSIIFNDFNFFRILIVFCQKFFTFFQLYFSTIKKKYFLGIRLKAESLTIGYSSIYCHRVLTQKDFPTGHICPYVCWMSSKIPKLFFFSFLFGSNCLYACGRKGDL